MTFREALYLNLPKDPDDWTVSHEDLLAIIKRDTTDLAYMEVLAIQEVIRRGGTPPEMGGDWSGISVNPTNWPAIMALIVSYLPKILST